MEVIEDLICNRLSEFAGLSEKLAVYDGKPAVFSRIVPEDTDEKWQGDSYPRILVELSQNEGMERQFEEGLKLQVICLKNQMANPKDFDEVIIQAADCCFFTKQEKTICSRWNRGEFSESGDTRTGIYIFDIMTVQKQQSQLPDPVISLNEWLKASYPDAKIIGYDILDECWKASGDNPAIFGRLESIAGGSNGDTWEVTWIKAGIRLHIISDKISKSFLIRDISEKLLKKNKLIMNDGGPMFISKVNYNDTMNPLKNRQFFIECQYGVLKDKEASQPIRTIDIQEGKSETARNGV